VAGLTILMSLDRDNAKRVFSNRQSWQVIEQLQQELAAVGLVREWDTPSDWSALEAAEAVKESINGRPLFEDGGRSVAMIRPDLVPRYSEQLQSLSDSDNGVNIEPLRDLYQKAAESGGAVLIVRNSHS